MRVIPKKPEKALMTVVNRVDQTFEALRKEKRAALIPYLTAGFPKLTWTLPLLKMLAEKGADVIELGVPFSDPIADGPTIQAACKIALDEGTTLKTVLEFVHEFREAGYQTPIVLFGALNPFLHFGLDKFAQAAAAAGGDAVLIPDVPVEEASQIRPVLVNHGLHLIPLVAPTTPLERKRLIVSQASGFIYYISVKGVTGARAHSRFELAGPVGELRTLTTLPVVVGFGIASPEQAMEVAREADGVVVGSALIDRVMQSADLITTIRDVGNWFVSLQKAVQSARH